MTRKLLCILCLALLTFVVACTPSKEEENKQKRIDDSLAEIDRNTTLNNAEALLNQEDSTLQADTVKKQ